MQGREVQQRRCESSVPSCARALRALTHRLCRARLAARDRVGRLIHQSAWGGEGALSDAKATVRACADLLCSWGADADLRAGWKPRRRPRRYITQPTLQLPPPNLLRAAARPVLRTLYNHTQVHTPLARLYLFSLRRSVLSPSLSRWSRGMCCLQPVNDLDWHPYKSILLSCGKDSTIKYAQS